jgi:hypothetical protein
MLWVWVAVDPIFIADGLNVGTVYVGWGGRLGLLRCVGECRTSSGISV